MYQIRVAWSRYLGQTIGRLRTFLQVCVRDMEQSILDNVPQDNKNNVTCLQRNKLFAWRPSSTAAALYFRRRACVVAQKSKNLDELEEGEVSESPRALSGHTSAVLLYLLLGPLHSVLQLAFAHY